VILKLPTFEALAGRHIGGVDAKEAPGENAKDSHDFAETLRFGNLWRRSGSCPAA